MSESARKNADFDWDGFDTRYYLEHNYRTLRGDDKRFIEAVRDYFAAAGLPSDAIGVDVGSGANLYPAFAMLPFVRRLTLMDYSRTNISWLGTQVEAFDQTWDPFWKTFCENPAYAAVTDPRAVLQRVCTVEQGNIFTVEWPEQYDVGTMFFVAESISDNQGEFELAVARFLDALRPGAPFAAAFMENSQGYSTGVTEYPAVRVGRRDVERVLSGAAESLGVLSEPVDPEGALRPGYDGMILAVGRKKP